MMFKSKDKQSGQVLVEYMLLLFISITFATFLTSELISRNSSKQGIIIQAWSKILRSLGNDIPDCPAQTDFQNPKCPP